MKDEYMFLTVIVPGPNNPKDKLDVFLQPLIAELNELWSVGAQTYDIHSKTNFTLRDSLLWTISDFPAYAMLSGWSTAGKLASPYCMEDSDAFTLKNGGKTSATKPPPHIKSGDKIVEELDRNGFQSVTNVGAAKVNSEIVRWCKCGWRKRSVFWDLPYWKTNLIRHNLDVMHIEKNVFDNIFNTILNVSGKTKDNAKSRQDLIEICERPELHRDDITNTYPKACYTLDKQSKVTLCKWLRDLKFPDGYASKLSRCVDMSKLKMFGMKSHDCHIFMQRLIPIAFRELLPNNVWQALIELSLLFKDVAARKIKGSDMVRLENDIPVIRCKLEKIFPPSFFDSMEHLPVHLPYEARTAGPVQYRWMYHFERFLRRLKNNVRNKARVYGSICNAYLVEEASYFCSHYFSENVKTRLRKQPRNNEVGDSLDEEVSNISIFRCGGRTMGTATPKRKLCLKNLAFGPLRKIKSYSGYYVNEFRFHTIRHGETRSIGNAGVTVNGSSNIENEISYYGNIEEIVEMEYPGLPIKSIVLFKCGWFDPTPKTGTRHHLQYELFDVNKNKKLNVYEPFIFAVQASQVFYVTYPIVKRSTHEWLAVCKMQPRSNIQVPLPSSISSTDNQAFQNEEVGHHVIDIEDITTSHVLVDVEILYEEIDDVEEVNENEIEIIISSGDEDGENHEFGSEDEFCT
ncbi:uncharacterized protein [Henckelia pumila]|uniref:uncharacterized protein n=1 Tax=Henckelia pumila TaxID=405737 RepID=UPI003C6E06E5